MTAAAKKIEQEFRQLPAEDLLALHEHLVVSIHEREEAEQLDPAFRDEIRRRVEEIDAGETEGVDAFEALKGM
jgi:putative addiction module component (TIGR02574 family)